MAPEPAEELLNVYDTEGRVVGAQPRRAAKASGLAVGAVNVLILDDRGQLLMQRRPKDKENGGETPPPGKSFEILRKVGDEGDASAEEENEAEPEKTPAIMEKPVKPREMKLISNLLGLYAGAQPRKAATSSSQASCDSNSGSIRPLSRIVARICSR